MLISPWLLETRSTLERSQHSTLALMQIIIHDIPICIWKSLKCSSIVSLPLVLRAHSYTLISLSLLHLPLLSPPISSWANSQLICNSQWQKNWCLILGLGNIIMWVMREWWGRKKRRQRKHFNMRKYLICLNYFSTCKAGIHYNMQQGLVWPFMP